MKPAEDQPAAPGTTETPAPAQPAEGTPAAPGTTETPAPADSNNQNNPTEPKDDVEKGLEENNSELESRKNIKLEEIKSSSLSSSEKEAAKLKVEEYTKKAKEAMKQAKTTEDQAAVVDNYSDDLAKINTPGVDQGKPDYTNSGLSGNGPEGTHIGDNNVIGHGNSTPENTGFRNASVYQPRVTRRARSVDEPKNKVSIYYNYDGMKDIPGFFNDLDSKNEVEVPQKAPAEALKSILKSKIDQKKAELERKGYKIADEYFVGIDQENATHYDYVVTFTKETTGTSGFRMAPAVQPRASRNRRSLEQPAPQKVKVNVFYNFDKMKDIAGFLGDIDGTSLEIAEGSTNEQVKAVAKSQVEAKKEELSKRGYTFKEDYVYQANGKDYNYVVTFSKATK